MIKNVYTKDGRVDGTPHVNPLEESFSEKRYSFQLEDFPDFYQDKKVLDLGCGWGAGTKLIANNGASEITAIDMNPDAIELAKDGYSTDNITYLFSHIDDFDYEMYDVIVAVEFVEHLTDKELGHHLDEWYNALLPGGKLYISTPHMRGSKDDYPRGSHFTEYMPDELEQIFKEHGFERVWYSSAQENKDTGFAMIFEKDES